MQTREICLDTETTGLSWEAGDRVIEIGCVELMGRVPTGRTYHVYVNPDREMTAGAEAVHGISREFLLNKPRFAEIASDFLAFIGNDPIVAHNASFDAGFLNAELARIGKAPLDALRVIDSLAIARKVLPGAKHSLDLLCARFGIDTSHRTLHGALLDAQLLAQVYIELTGGRQIGLSLEAAAQAAATQALNRPYRPPRPHSASPDELAAHGAFVQKLNDPVWLKLI
jgi:DNA polymerase III subunit epsilon